MTDEIQPQGGINPVTADASWPLDMVIDSVVIAAASEAGGWPEMTDAISPPFSSLASLRDLLSRIETGLLTAGIECRLTRAPESELRPLLKKTYYDLARWVEKQVLATGARL